MAPRLKVLTGGEVVQILGQFGFVTISQRGSHMKLRRHSATGDETLIVPDRNPVPKGTLKAIFNQASRYISAEELHKQFYN